MSLLLTLASAASAQEVPAPEAAPVVLVDPKPREDSILRAPLFRQAPGVWLAVSGIGVAGGLALSVWKINDFFGIVGQGPQRPQVPEDLVLASLGLVLAGGFSICLGEFIDQLDPARRQAGSGDGPRPPPRGPLRPLSGGDSTAEQDLDPTVFP